MISREQVLQVLNHFDRLPLVLVARILQHVEQSERLSNCATVCKGWAAAAATATVGVDLAWPFDHHPDARSKYFQRVTRLQPWLEQHSKQLVLLRVTPCRHYSTNRGISNAQLQLSCLSPGLQQLSRLELSHIKLSVEGTHRSSGGGDSNSSSQAVSPMLPKFTELQLVACRISPTFLAQLLQLSGLSALKLQQVEDSHGEPLEEVDLYSTMLPRLPNLAHLELSYRSDFTPKMLPGSLTALGLQGGKLDFPCSLTQLVLLRKLELTRVKFNPAMISGMSKLLHLHLKQFTLLLPDEGVEGANSAAVMLTAVGGMRQLQHLAFDTINDSWRSQGLQGSHFSSLTASTHLTHLELVCWDNQPLPAKAVQYMFPAGKQFPELQELTMRALDATCAGPGYITTAELRNILSACPAISSLHISCVLHLEADIQALLQLPPACRTLGIGGEAHDDGAAAVIAQLTQLTRLSWTQSSDLSDAGLDRLTALQALEVLQLRELHGLSDGLMETTDGFMDDLDLTAGDQPVWQQLHDKVRSVFCNASWSRRLDSLAQVREQEASTARLQLDALSNYMDHVLVVVMFCSGSAEVLQSVRSMAGLGRKVLSGTAIDAGQSHPAGAGGGAEVVAGLGQQYRELQAPVKEFCRASKEVIDALACMEAAVLQAVEGISSKA